MIENVIIVFPIVILNYYFGDIDQRTVPLCPPKTYIFRGLLIIAEIHFSAINRDMIIFLSYKSLPDVHKISSSQANSMLFFSTVRNTIIFVPSRNHGPMFTYLGIAPLHYTGLPFVCPSYARLSQLQHYV